VTGVVAVVVAFATVLAVGAPAVDCPGDRAVAGADQQSIGVTAPWLRGDAI
jgi:hypothetical protein